jgi:Asp-tRNA(Asn)/Glu-tRNA(Gln) amidotransferase A subunit family amidase
MGLQLIGPPQGEPILLQAGHAFEQATDWLSRLPSC